MSSNYAGVNTYHGQITIPSDGDPAIAESVNVALRSLQDDAVYFATEIAKRLNVVDGGTYTMLGTSVTIQGTPNFNWNVDTFFLDTVTFGATGTAAIVSCYSELRVRGDAHLVGQNTTIGSGGTQDLTVYADATFKSNLRAEDDVRLGIDIADNVVVDGTLSVTNPATFNDTVSIPDLTVTDSAVLGSGSTSDVTVNGQLSVLGSTTLGTNGNDSVTIAGSLSVAGSSALGNATSDLTAITGDLTVTGDTTLGNNTSNDSVTIEAALTANGDINLAGAIINKLVFGGAGRVPFRYGVVSTTQTLDITSGNLFRCVGSPLLSLSSASAGNGDFMLFCQVGSGSTTVNGNNSVTMGPSNKLAFAYFDTSGSGWNVLLVSAS